MSPLIDVRDLTKTYLLGDIVVHALQGVTLAIERGTFVAIMGESGSGKSTLLNLLGCLDRPTSGRYLLDSIPVETMDRDQLAEIRNQKIGFIFQNFNLLPRMDALENVELPLLYKDSETPNGDELGQRALADVGLAGRELNFPAQLSGGQQQRVAIARALINKPEILLADEPTGALDSHNGAEIMNIFQRLNRTQGITIVMVTHSDEIAAYANRIIGFRDGLIVSDTEGDETNSIRGSWRGPCRCGGIAMKHLISSMRIAFRALKMNKLRSALTMLGIVIGVASVIATVAIGSGATQRIQQQIASIGSNIIIVIPGSMSSSGVRLGTGNAVTLSEADAKEIVAQCPDVELAAPVVRGGAQVVYANNNWATSIYGITPDYLTIRDLSVADGAEFTQQDIDGANKVAVLGQTPVDNLFDGADPIGQVIRIKNVPFTVVGVLTRKGQSSQGQDQDDVILLPISTAKRKVIGVKQANADAVDTIMMQAKSGAQIPAAQDEAGALLRQRHHLQAGEADDFSIRNLEELFAAQEASSSIMAIMLAAVASVSLVVGGIGIMNIMLISVRERTREIGLRQALGAKTRDILTQFLVEAVTLSIAGGFIGIVFGIGASLLISQLAGWATSVGPGAVLLAVFFSALVGIGFGYYPARKAAFLDPIEALRSE